MSVDMTQLSSETAAVSTSTTMPICLCSVSTKTPMRLRRCAYDASVPRCVCAYHASVLSQTRHTKLSCAHDVGGTAAAMRGRRPPRLPHMDQGDARVLLISGQGLGFGACGTEVWYCGTRRCVLTWCIWRSAICTRVRCCGTSRAVLTRDILVRGERAREPTALCMRPRALLQGFSGALSKPGLAPGLSTTPGTQGSYHSLVLVPR
eukprot:3806275-Rhodomonas_salina.1